MHQELVTKYQKLKDKNLSIDITRGKPDTDQLDLSNDLIDISISSTSDDLRTCESCAKTVERSACTDKLEP